MESSSASNWRWYKKWVSWFLGKGGDRSIVCCGHSLSLTGASQQAAGDGAKCEYPGFLAKVVTDLLSAVATLSLLQEHLSKLLGMVQNVSTLVSWERWWQICCLLWLLSHRKGTWLRWLLAMACRNHVQSHEELPLWLLSTLVTPFEASCSLLSKSHNTVWEAHNLLRFA
jgi:hypothetical protein